MSVLRLWLADFKQALTDEMAYRGNFILKAAGLIFFNLFGPLAVYLIYKNSLGLPGWSFEQLLLFQGIAIFIMGCNHAFFSAISWRTSWQIRAGLFDANLIRPYRTLTYIFCTATDFEGLAEIGTGIVITLYALLHLSLPITLSSVSSFLVLIAMGLLFILSLNIIIAALSFFVVESHALSELLFNIMNLGDYPLTIYGPFGIFLFTFVFPIGLAAFYPAQALLGLLSAQKIFELCLVAFTFFGISLMLWKAGLRHFESAGG